MRLRPAWLSLVVVCAASGALAQSPNTPTCTDLHIVPAPRECAAVESVALNRAGINVLSETSADDEFAAADLKSTLKDQDIALSEHGVRVYLIRAENSTGKEILARNKLTFDPAMHDEGYVIAPDGKHGLAVLAESSAGLFYGAQTVKQLIHGTGKDAVLVVPTIRDWPAMPNRGLSDDWSRGPLPNTEFLKREIRTLAAYKYNIFSPYFEHTFAYSSTPVAAFPGGALTPDQAKELVDYAAKYHIMVIPEQESFGHLHHVLKFEEYSHLGETPRGSVLAPGDSGTLPLIDSWFGELAKVFPAPYAHIGADETFELGLGRTRAEVEQQGLGRVYLDFLGKIHAQLAPYHKRLLFWGDIAENSPDLVGILPKDMIAVSWHYDNKPDFTQNLEPFIKSGLETWVAPGVNNWNRVYPDNNDALGNIRNFVRDGQHLGAKGMLNTVWNDDGEGIFDENWFGVLFGAAASWQHGESSEQAFINSYGQAFHNDPTGKLSQAQVAIMAAHAELRKAGLEDAQDDLFWVDPFSEEGEAVSAKLLPVAPEVRLNAEQAITLIAQARSDAKAAGRTLENEAAIDALELGARRIDFIGMKFESAADCVALYKQAQSLAADKTRWNEVDDLLETIGSNNGRIQDIRDGYALIGQLYKNAWLTDDRPYWLPNNMAKYELNTQLWISRGDKFDIVRNRWYDTHTLPSLTDAGLPAQ
jgi:hexosaminidase